MSDSEDDAAFASADEGEDLSVRDSAESKPTATKDSVEKGKGGKKADHKETAKGAGNEKTEPPSGSKGQRSNEKNQTDKADGKKSESASANQGKNSKGKKGRKKKDKSASEKKGVPASEAAEKVQESRDGRENKELEDIQSESTAVVETDDTTDAKKSSKPNENLSGDGKSQKEETETANQVPSSTEDDTTKQSPVNTVHVEQAETRMANTDKEDSTSQSPKSALDKLTGESKEKPSGWGWSSWGSTLMDVASNSVSTFGNQLGDGFSTIIDTVESTLGAPTPEELAQEKSVTKPPEEGEQIERQTEKDKAPVDEEVNKPSTSESKPKDSLGEDAATGGGGGGGGWFSSWGVSSLTSVVHNTTNLVQNTSKNLVTGSLDVLETIGKKTFEVIQEQDPGLHKTKEVLFDRKNKTNLSQMLREAKDEADAKVEMEKNQEEARKANFGVLFDEYQGLAHLEALEILSNQCEKTVQSLLVSLPEESLRLIKTELIKIKQVFEREEDEDEDEESEHDFTQLVTENLSELHLGTTPDKLNKAQEKIRQSIADFYAHAEEEEKIDAKAMHQTAIQSLAILTAKSVEQFHKAGELIVLQKDTNKTFLERAKCLSSLTDLLCTEVRIISTKFCQCLNKLAEDDEGKTDVKSAVTNIYLEASNSSTYIYDAFQLLLPCLQQAAIQTSTVLSS